MKAWNILRLDNFILTSHSLKIAAIKILLVYDSNSRSI